MRIAIGEIAFAIGIQRILIISIHHTYNKNREALPLYGSASRFL